MPDDVAPAAKFSSPAEALAVSLAAIAAGFAFLWLHACLASVLWLAHRMPLAPQDLAHASWLNSYTTATHFSGVLGTAMCAVLVLMGVSIAVAKRTPVPMLAALLVAAAGNMVTDEGHYVRIGILAGHIKIGCFVEEMRECHEMLGLDSKGLPSRYEASGLDARWYVDKRARIDWNPMYSMPGSAFLAAPLYAHRADELERKLNAQRAELAAHLERHRAAAAREPGEAPGV